MYVPFLSKPPRRLFRRKGGGKGGGGGKPGGGGSGSGGGKTGSISKGTTSTGGESYSFPKHIKPGQNFAGRIEGGASRTQIFGTRAYGSGYPGSVGRGVAGRGFPFFFWPIVWPIAAVSGLLYLQSEQEYGSPSNSSRPGGILAYATFPSSSTSPPTVVFRVLADNATIMSLIPDLNASCTTYLSNSSTSPNELSKTITPFSPPYTFSNVTGPANPQPEQVIQYYRASTLSLTLDSYNNTATYSPEGTPDSSLPILGLKDVELMKCLNRSIGSSAPLVGSGTRMDIPLPIFFSFWLVWWLCDLLI